MNAMFPLGSFDFRRMDGDETYSVFIHGARGQYSLTMSIWSRLRSLFGEPNSAVSDADEPQSPSRSADADDPPVPDMRVNRDSDVEAAARLRIAQVQRALRGASDAPPNPSDENAGAEPPWARGKNRPGRLPSGPGRPHDAAFVLTVVLASELPNDAATLSACFDCAAWPQPKVRLIPLLRNGVAEPGFAAEVTTGERRAFLVYRQEPYAEAGGGHVGMLIGGPGTRPGASTDPADAEKPTDEALLSPLARSLLASQSDAVGVVWNRDDKRFRPRDEALAFLDGKPATSE